MLQGDAEGHQLIAHVRGMERKQGCPTAWRRAGVLAGPGSFSHRGGGGPGEGLLGWRKLEAGGLRDTHLGKVGATWGGWAVRWARAKVKRLGRQAGIKGRLQAVEARRGGGGGPGMELERGRRRAEASIIF